MDRFILTRRVAVLGIVVNFLLLIAKLTVGFMSRSQAMIADGFNSAGDVFASGMTLIGNKIASKPQDQNHPYGHGKAEYVFSMMISFSLLLVAYKIFDSAFQSIRRAEALSVSWQLIGVAAATIILKLTLFVYTRKVGHRQNNLLVIANSEDHRNDVFVTASTLLGVLSARFGVHWVDGAVGIGISLWIFYTGIKIFTESYRVLMDTGINLSHRRDIIETLNNIHGIDHIDSISAKPVGVNFILIVKVSVQSSMTVEASHRIAAVIRRELRTCRNIADVVVHINPA